MSLSDGNAFLDQLMAVFRAGNAEAAPPEHERLVARVRDIYACIIRNDFEALGEFMTEDAILDIHAPSMPVFQGVHSGRAEVLAAIERNFSQVGEQIPEIRDVVVQGDTVVILSRESGRTLPEGRPYTLSWLQFFTFRDGLVCLFRERVS